MQEWSTPTSFLNEPEEFIREIPFTSIADSYPHLVRQAKAIATTHYGVSIPI